MESVSLIEAWQLWARGEQTDSFHLWWWSIFWWGRIGKILAAAGILGFALEIIGDQRIIRFGTWLKRAVHIEFEAFRIDFGDWALTLMYRVTSALDPAEIFGWPSQSQEREEPDGLATAPSRNPRRHRRRVLITPAGPELGSSSEPSTGPPSLRRIIRERPLATVLWLAISTGASVALTVWWASLQIGDDVAGPLLLLTLLGVIYAIVGPVATWLVSIALVLVVIGFDKVVIKPVAGVMANRRINTWLRLGIFLLVVVGFHFDLLAS